MIIVIFNTQSAVRLELFFLFFSAGLRFLATEDESHNVVNYASACPQVLDAILLLTWREILPTDIYVAV